MNVKYLTFGLSVVDYDSRTGAAERLETGLEREERRPCAAV
jgi:hypothetical protein